MAYRVKKSDKPSAFSIISKAIKEDAVPSVMLLCGKEQYLVDWTINAIRKKYINKATESLDYCRIDGQSTSLDHIIEACDTLSMFSEKRIVEIYDFPILTGKHLKGFGEEQEKQLCDYLKIIPDTTILIFSCENPNSKSQLEKTISKNKGLFRFETLSQKDLEGFIIKHLKSAKKYCKSMVLEEIISLSGYYHYEAEYTLYNLENDLRKIVAHSNDEEIILSDVISTISGNLETNAYAMVDALSRGRKDEAYRLLFNINPIQDEMKKLLALTISQFELILKVKELKDEGKNQEVMAECLGVHPYRIKKAVDFSTQCNRETFKKILTKAYLVDYNSKSGLLSDRMAFELFIATA